MSGSQCEQLIRGSSLFKVNPEPLLILDHAQTLLWSNLGTDPGRKCFSLNDDGLPCPDCPLMQGRQLLDAHLHLIDDHGTILSFLRNIKYFGKDAVLLHLIDLSKTDLDISPAGIEQKILNSTSDFIVSIDSGSRISIWNNSFSAFTGIPKKEILRRHLFKSSFPGSILPLIEFMQGLYKNMLESVKEINITDRLGNQKTIVFSATGDQQSILLIGKESGSKTTLTASNAYISFRPQEEDIEMIEQMVKEGYTSIHVLREELPNIHGTRILLSTRNVPGWVSETSLEGIVAQIACAINSGSKCVVLLSRLDYLSVHYGFDAVLRSLYMISDMVKSAGGLLIINVQKDSFSQMEVSRITCEFRELRHSTKKETYLDPKYLDILRFISRKNSCRIIAGFKCIRDAFNLSKKTTKRWLTELEKESFIRTEVKGRRKLVYLTDQGRSAISNHEGHH